MNIRKHLPISIHHTLSKQLEVNWQHDYTRKYNCPNCNTGKLTNVRYCKNTSCKILLRCDFCHKSTALTCQVPNYIYNYRSDLECPNINCRVNEHNKRRGWIYKIETKGNHKCRFCNITFDYQSKYHSSWMGLELNKNKIARFSFDENIWDLRYFFEKPYQKSINFQNIKPQWYRIEVKYYIHYLLQSKTFSSVSRIRSKITTLKQFGEIIIKQKLKNKLDISRNSLILFLDEYKNNSSRTINTKIGNLKDFFQWLDLEESSLIRGRDFLKTSKNDADWLDETSRKGIKQNLAKIPAFIARYYLIQQYLAARPGDVCQLPFDCLLEENSKWYVKFFQQKTKRWHKILASRKIRKTIEEQQQWIREVFGEEYTYLFCHFRSIKQADYPNFDNIKPLLEPPKFDSHSNPMVRILRMLIDKENILDANGQKPHFTGKITRHSRLQEVRTQYGMEAAQLYGDHRYSDTTFQHYAPPTREQIAEVDLPFQELLMNPDNKFLPW